ncbi:adenosylcobinamide amidohydrolase [Salinifilum aidingensis]
MTAAPEPELRSVRGRPVLVWRCDRPWLAISSGPCGGGLGTRRWVLNAMVHRDYVRPDPAAHVDEIRAELDLPGSGAGLLTAVDVREAVTAADAGVQACVTTGVTDPVWAAAPEPALHAPEPGTINAVCFSPVRLSDAALVNAVSTVAEAKAQALVEAGVAGTGTVTDATAVLCPPDGPAEDYGGPRSRIGSSLARAVHRAVTGGLRSGG